MAAPTYSKYSFYQPVPAKKKPVLGVDYGKNSFYQPYQEMAGQPVDAGGSGGVAPPPAAGPPGSIRAPGYDPDYTALITGDPTYVAGMSDLDLSSGQLGDRRTAAIRTAIINAGLVPGGYTGGDIDAATIAAAQQNPWSGVAELGRGRDRGVADTAAALAGRGILSSGALTGGNNMVQEGYERGTYQLGNQLLGTINGYENNYQEGMAAIRAQGRGLRAEAALRVQNDPRYAPIGETDAVLDSASGLYVTPDGRWYDKDRNRVAAPAGRVGVNPPAPAQPAAQPATGAPPPLITEYPRSRPLQNVVPGQDLRAQ